MPGQFDAVNRWAEWWSTLAVAALWQGALVALLVAAVCHTLRHSSPAARYWLWQVVPIKLLLLPLALWSVNLAWLPARTAAEAARETRVAPQRISLEAALAQVLAAKAAEDAPPSPAPPPAEPALPTATLSLSDLTWRSWLMLAWAAIVVAQLARLGLLAVRLSRLLGSTAAGDPALVATVGQVANELGLRRSPRVLVTEREGSPFVCGLVRPAIVLPRVLLATLDANDLRQVLFHELAHLKRRDLVWGWIPEIARAIYFFHPAMHWAYGRIRLERELACDLAAMMHSGRASGEYAQTLVRVLSAAAEGQMFLPAAAPLNGNAAGGFAAEETA